ncbi:MAG: M20/M25/M40 family metallo-hydrolase [Acidobacteria bacterium]|nr:M20/M25/M40 family metallo-hydrolase [Acidobacteriota bacterium]
MSRIQDYAQQRAEVLLEEIQELVLLESPSQDRGRVNRAVEWMEERLQAAGALTTRVPQTEAGDQLIARLGAGPDKTLLLGHLDTVWDAGQLVRMPVRLSDGKAYGPGIFDMKSGAVLMLELFRMAGRKLCTFPTSLVAFFNSDEEVGSGTSRAALEEVASECRQALVLEPCLPGGRAKTFRKGVGIYTLEIFGKSAHAGVSPGRGVSAVEEFAHQVFALKQIVGTFQNASLNIGVVQGGTRSNVVPEYLRAEIDIRISSSSDGPDIDRSLRALAPVLSGATFRVSGGINRPPLERTSGVGRLYEKAATVAKRQGWTLGEGSTGGGSDGSLTAALGIPTLDGLGVDGDGAHAVDEHIIIEDIPRRLALLAGLLERI